MKSLLILFFTLFSFLTIAQDLTEVQKQQLDVNYLINGGFENGKSGWSTYNDGASATPVDGVGGTANITLTTTTTLPHDGKVSGVLTKDAVNRQGQGIKRDFSIPDIAKGKVVRLNFSYEITSGTYSNGDSALWIYDVTNSRLIQPSAYTIENSGLKESKFVEFQSSIDSNLYRLIIHVTSTSASAYTLKLDSFNVGLTPKIYGSAITDPIDYTPTISPNTNATPTAKWHREGKYLVVDGKVTWTGTGSQAYIVFSLPSGLSIDTTALPSGSVDGSTYLGSGAGAQQAVQSVQSVVAYNNTTSVAIYGGVSGTPASNKLAFDSNLFASAPTAGSYMNFYFKVPILGWSSSQIMSSDADTRVVAGRYSLSSSQSIPDNSSTVIVWNSIANGGFDTHGAMNTTNGRYYAKVSGYYSFNVGFGTNSGISIASGNRSIIYYRVNSDFSRQLSWTSYSVSGTERISENGGASAYLNAGDYIEFLAVMDFDSPSYNIESSGGGITYLSINRISGPSQIASSESVEATYSATSAQNIANNVEEVINFNTKLTDTHNAVTTGTNWKFTAPISGKYLVTSYILFSSNATGVRDLYTYKNTVGTVICLGRLLNVSQGTLSCTTVVSLLAGETIFLRGYQNSGGSLALEATDWRNKISIIRVGNY